MTAPGYCLGAHDYDLLACRESNEPLQTGFEFRRLHVIGETPERGVVPAGVRGVWACMAQSPQLLNVGIGDSCETKSFRQGVAIKLRVVTRARDGPHIHQVGHAVNAEHLDEGVKSSRRMADSEDRRQGDRHALPAHRTLSDLLSTVRRLGLSSS